MATNRFGAEIKDKIIKARLCLNDAFDLFDDECNVETGDQKELFSALIHSASWVVDALYTIFSDDYDEKEPE